MLKRKALVLSVSLIVLLVAAGPVAAAGVDWDTVKSVWNTLTPDEQAAYRAQMPAEWSQQRPQGKARILGQDASLVPGDTCGAATNEVGALPYSDSGDTAPLANDYDIATATCSLGFDSTGPDNVYRVRVDTTCDVLASLDSSGVYDTVLWAVTDCADTDNTCVGADDSGEPEEFTFTASAGTDYFVIVDGWSGQGGTYTLDISEATATGCVLVPVELESFNVFNVE